MAAEKPDGLTFRVTYPNVNDVPIFYVNQFLLQKHMGEFILTAAQFGPPLLMGSVEEQREQARALGQELPMKVLARFAMNKEQLITLSQVLRRHAESLDDGESDSDTLENAE